VNLLAATYALVGVIAVVAMAADESMATGYGYATAATGFVWAGATITIGRRL
jgi:hypothetical protein